MRSIHQALTPGDPRSALPRHRRSRLPAEQVDTEHFEVIRFDWKIKAGVQPVMLVTRRRLH